MTPNTCGSKARNAQPSTSVTNEHAGGWHTASAIGADAAASTTATNAAVTTTATTPTRTTTQTLR
eukprot:15176589-Alexandrium_andersonii.AAC.1